MNHPLLALLLLSELVASAAALYWGWGALNVLTAEEANRATAQVLRMERRDESARIAGSAAHLFWLFSLFLFVMSCASVLPGMIPGTMCGTGVIRAMSENGIRAVITRILVLLLLSVWQTTRRFDEADPTAGLRQVTARISLLTVTVGLLSTWQVVAAVYALDVTSTQDCCAAVREAAKVGPLFYFPDTAIVIGFFVTSALLLIGLVTFLVSPRYQLGSGMVSAAAATIFIPFAAASVIYVFSSYHFGTLSHHCAWCLFAWRHKAVGYPLSAALLIVFIESAAFVVALRLHFNPQMTISANRRGKKAALRIAVAAIIFILTAVLPAVLWRIRFGVWMNR